ncbi:MAG TPA: flagellar protein FlaG [Solirubrobacteraceae bacterium]|jgi:flagellar protein FlaG
MSLGIGSLGPTYPAPDATPRSRFAPSAPADPMAARIGEDRVELSYGAPPPEVREAVDRAAERVHELAAQNRELHFHKDKDSGRVIVEVRDLDGNVIRTIPNEKALHVMAGASL